MGEFVGGGTVGVAVAAAVNVIDTDTNAYIAENATVNGNQAGAGSGRILQVSVKYLF